jgi:hypothetical protein
MRPSTKNDFIQKAAEVHGDRYDYSRFIYVKSNVKGKIVCKVHGEFWQVPSSHLQGSGCPKCAPINRIQNIPFTTRVFIDNAIKLHGSKCDYSNVKYINAFKRITIICPLHGIFFSLQKIIYAEEDAPSVDIPQEKV